MKFLVKFLMKGFVFRGLMETQTDRFTDAQDRQMGKRENREGGAAPGKGKGCGDGQDSYQGSREPAGQAGRREGLRRSYNPWRSEPCRSPDRTAGEKQSASGVLRGSPSPRLSV